MPNSTKQCEFFLLRYVPDAVKDEFVNIGVVLVEQASGFAGVRFTTDWSRVRCLDPAADLELLQALEADLRKHLADAADRESLLRRMNDSFSGTLQLSPAKACLAESPQQELARLAELYVETARRPERGRAAAGRQRIFNTMRDAFQREGVWDDPRMLKRIGISKYTRTGDPLRLDCGYRPENGAPGPPGVGGLGRNGVVRLFHAVSLEADVDLAKVLAFSFPQVREGIRREEQASAELTAIVEDALDRTAEPIAFALETLSSAHIAVASLADMHRIASTARLELKL